MKSPIISVPGTPFVVLRDDTNLTPKAIAAQTILLEAEIAALDCVKAIRVEHVVLDIGAFIGDTALIFKQYSHFVLAFEPQPDAFEALCHNSPDSLNFNVPVGDGARVLCGEEGIGGNLGTRQTLFNANGIRSLPLDVLGMARIDFIKIDVEGAEVAVLRGAVDTIQRCKPLLLIEVYPEMLERQLTSRGELEEQLKSLGYEWQPVIGNETEPRWDILAKPKRPA